MFTVFFVCIVSVSLTQGDTIVFTTPVPPHTTDVFPTRLRTDSVPCSKRERECFSKDRVLYIPTNKCYRLLTQGPCKEGEIFVVLKKPYYEYDQVIGACRVHRPCDNANRIRMADGLCYDVARPFPDAPVTLCPFNENLLAETNIFGEGSCCSEPNCWSTYVPVTQPSSKERCYAVNLATYRQWGEYPKIPLMPLDVKCNTKHLKCFQKNKVLYSRDGNCYGLLKQCGEDRWVTVNKTHFVLTQEMDLMCVRQRCPPGQVYMSADWSCRTVWDLQNIHCAGDDILFDVFGDAHCARGISQSEMLALPLAETRDGWCSMDLPLLLGYDGGIDSWPGPRPGGAISVGKNLCAETDKTPCEPEPVLSTKEPPGNDSAVQIEVA